jgi:hypothetical protein
MARRFLSRLYEQLEATWTAAAFAEEGDAAAALEIFPGRSARDPRERPGRRAGARVP